MTNVAITLAQGAVHTAEEYLSVYSDAAKNIGLITDQNSAYAGVIESFRQAVGFNLSAYCMAKDIGVFPVFKNVQAFTEFTGVLKDESLPKSLRDSILRTVVTLDNYWVNKEKARKESLDTLSAMLKTITDFTVKVSALCGIQWEAEK